MEKTQIIPYTLIKNKTRNSQDPLPLEVYEEYELHRVTPETLPQCAHTLAKSFTTYNPVHKYLGITYEEDFIYYSVILQRGMEDGLAFYVKRKDLDQVLLVSCSLDLYHYQKSPISHLYFSQLKPHSGLHKLRDMMSKLKGMDVLKPEFFGQYVYFYCAGVNMDYVTKEIFSISDKLTSQFFGKQTNYLVGIGETLTIITERSSLKSGNKILADVLFDDYVYVDGTKPLKGLKEFAMTLNQKNTYRACLFLYYVHDKNFKITSSTKF